VNLSLRARIRVGDQQAFVELFHAHAQTLYGHAARFLGDCGAAEDAVSVTFLEAWRLRGKLLPDAEFAAREGPGSETDDGLRAWLFGISTNVLRNMRRATRRYRAALDRLPEQQGASATVPDFAEEVVGRMDDVERLAAARAALLQLRPREREVFALCVWSGLTYADAAAAL
jgi:RNA polymerase sigma-70 factor (ECF subfamily)